MEKKALLNIYDYHDYRKFLQDYYDLKKQSNDKYSYRIFARASGVGSAGLLMDVIKGRRNLSNDRIVPLAKTFGFKKRDTEYFADMVAFTQAKSHEEKTHYLERMMRFYDKAIYKVNVDQYEFFSKWYYIALRELLFIEDVSEKDYETTAKMLKPQISPIEVKRSIKVMERLKLIKKNEDGFWKPNDILLTTGAEIRSFNAMNFQKTMMELALEAIDRHPQPTRDISCLTLSINKEMFEAIKNECILFRKRILNIADSNKGLDRLYQLNIQLFPLSNAKKRA